MVTEPQIQLTTKDHAILQTLLDRHSGSHDLFERLLGEKLRASVVLSDADMPAGVITIGNQVTYRVDGVVRGPQILVADLPDGSSKVLSIQTIHGLALLGLAEGASIAVELGDGATQMLQVLSVCQQRHIQATSPATQHSTASQTGAAVLHFRPRKAAQPLSGHDDDDPGPSAA